mgnify:CR=1 FL=1
MINNKRVLAYIPARSGSKGIIDKNIADVCGKPLIAYSIESTKKSKYVDKIIVSTDSEKYAEICKRHGAEVPFIRPAELAGDQSKEIDVVLHVLDWCNQNNLDFDIIIKLQPTSPLRLAEDIDKAIEMLENKCADAITSVSEVDVHPWWTNQLPENLSMKNFIKPEAIKNRQELPNYYQLNGVLFAAKRKHLLEKRSWFAENSFATIIPAERSIDIDNPIQLELVRIMVRKNHKELENVE